LLLSDSIPSFFATCKYVIYIKSYIYICIICLHYMFILSVTMHCICTIYTHELDIHYIQ
jgi:hypothetical protein